MAFADFLEGIPPSQSTLIADMFEPERHFSKVVTPQLLLHCASDMCNGPRAHRRVGDAPEIYLPIDEGPTGTAYKFDELPPFGPMTPTRLLKLP